MKNPTDADIKAAVTNAMEPYHPGAASSQTMVISDIVRDIRALIGPEDKPEE